MARLFGGQGSGVTRALLPAILLLTITAARAQLYEQPVLVIDPGMHTAPIRDGGVDAAGRIAVTGSKDKTLRVWSLPDGALLRTIRIPAGPENAGQVYAIAVDADGTLVAAGGWMASPPSDQPIYVFDTQTGKMASRISGGPNSPVSLAFSPDGQYLAVGLFRPGGLRVYDRHQQWREVFRDTDYGGTIWGVTFSTDGRLATASEDGKVRLYRAFRLPPKQVNSGRQPIRIAFSPDGALLAVGHDAPTLDLLDGHSLIPQPGPNVGGLGNVSLGYVTWSRDGRTLYAGGRDRLSGRIFAWPDVGHGVRRTFPAESDIIADLAALPDGRLFVATQEPLLELLEPDGKPRWRHLSPVADFRNQQTALSVSADGTIVDFGFEFGGKSRLRFDLSALALSADPPPDQKTFPPKLAGSAAKNWLMSHPRRTPIPLEQHERLLSGAIDPDSSKVVLGSDWSLRGFYADGQLIWQHFTPGAVWAVDISGDGHLVITANDDGTIRWHRMGDGRELLALYVLADKQNWVAWTPEGFYSATGGAFGMLQWQVNRGLDAAAETVSVDTIPRLRRPEVLALVLQEQEIVRALGIAELKAARRDVQTVTRSAKAPGATLHVLTIGVSEYGDKAPGLKLNFAARDAQEVARALVKTQEGGLYTEVKAMFLHDGEANKHGIVDALAAMDRNMMSSAGQNLAVVMFSGHGAMIDNQFYLVPYGADVSTMEHLKTDAIPASEFKSEIEKLARHGLVLVLLDACHSAGLMGGAANVLPAVAVLRSVMNTSNVTVLTSSAADKVSREDEKWGHGAFTKALLDALSASDDVDTNHNGVISMGELTAYMKKHLTELTGGDQQLGIDQRFEDYIFVDGL